MHSKLYIAAIAAFTAMASPVFALEDTSQNRQQQTDRYLAAVPPQTMMTDMASKVAQNLPPDQQDEFKQAMTKYLDLSKVTSAISAAMTKTFTADEIQALADFYGSTVGKSALAKMGDYYATVMPTTMGEIQSALGKAQEDAEKSQASKADAAKTDAGKTDANKPDAGKADSGKPAAEPSKTGK